MVSKAQKFRLGVFITVTSFLFLGFVFLVAGKKMMEKRDIYYVRFHDVSINGLQIGSAVKYHGISIGRVDDISIDVKNVRDIIVTLSIKQGTPIKEDVEAVLTPVGITGLMQIELRGGTNKKNLLSPGAFIKAGSSTFQNITGKAEIITEKLEILLNNINELINKENRTKFDNIISNLNDMVEKNNKKVGNILDHTDSLIIQTQAALQEVNVTVKTINDLLNSQSMKNIVKNTEKISDDLAKIDIKQLSSDVKSTIKRTNKTIAHLDGLIISNRQDIKVIIDNLRETVDYLNDFSRQLSENPGVILKTRKQ